jgi:hypothetical protein
MIEQIARRHENMICGFYPAEYAPNDIATLLRIARAAKAYIEAKDKFNDLTITDPSETKKDYEAYQAALVEFRAALKGDGDK